MLEDAAPARNPAAKQETAASTRSKKAERAAAVRTLVLVAWTTHSLRIAAFNRSRTAEIFRHDSRSIHTAISFSLASAVYQVKLRSKHDQWSTPAEIILRRLEEATCYQPSVVGAGGIRYSLSSGGTNLCGGFRVI